MHSKLFYLNMLNQTFVYHYYTTDPEKIYSLIYAQICMHSASLRKAEFRALKGGEI